MSTNTWTPFISGPEQWTNNIRSIEVRQAKLTTPNGENTLGLFIKQARTWLVIPDSVAIEMANDILDAIETRTTAEIDPA
ncbi:hypothetical protein [Arthrobacter antibioticus]|uniref:hypothetical protein n=1 Tax=Arthrobacter sp. H35-MC1 TaxID=3046203 RepID=UPI0024BAEE68|nr:hypothetical protein [Arthrobacter sp. H35-MC1]MDJ0317855.1 hypothetical protein [Arthrobacter sp. H35-MC1]